MIITADRLTLLCPEANRDIIAAVAPSLDDAAPHFGVTSAGRRACLLGQLAEESDRFRRLRENLHYSAERIGMISAHSIPRCAFDAARQLEGHAGAFVAFVYGYPISTL